MPGHALNVDDVWDSDYTWTMNAWVQAIVWRYKAGLLADPVTACAEELLYVYNNLEHSSKPKIHTSTNSIAVMRVRENRIFFIC